jgi:hypothetical protein
MATFVARMHGQTAALSARGIFPESVNSLRARGAARIAIKSAHAPTARHESSAGPPEAPIACTVPVLTRRLDSYLSNVGQSSFIDGPDPSGVPRTTPTPRNTGKVWRLVSACLRILAGACARHSSLQSSARCTQHQALCAAADATSGISWQGDQLVAAGSKRMSVWQQDRMHVATSSKRMSVSQRTTALQTARSKCTHARICSQCTQIRGASLLHRAQVDLLPAETSC